MIPCIFLGYISHHKGFRCLDKTIDRIYICRHAQFDENSFPYATATKDSTDPSILYVLIFQDPLHDDSL